MVTTTSMYVHRTDAITPEVSVAMHSERFEGPFSVDLLTMGRIKPLFTTASSAEASCACGVIAGMARALLPGSLRDLESVSGWNPPR